jgi:hypothetical protein
MVENYGLQPQLSAWDSLRKQARQLEAELDTKLLNYGKFTQIGMAYPGSSTSTSGPPSMAMSVRMAEAAEIEINNLMSKVVSITI